MAEFDIVGLDNVMQQFQGLPGRIVEAASKALYEEALRIMANSQPLVPV
jgi:hypothetical protein